MSALNLAKILHNKTVKNDELRHGIEVLEEEIKKNLQLQQTELIHLEEKYHNLMKTHILSMIEKRGEEFLKNDILKRKIVDACKKSTQKHSEMKQLPVQKMSSNPKVSSSNETPDDLQVLKALRKKKMEMYQSLQKRSIVEKLQQKMKNKLASSTKHKTHSKSPTTTSRGNVESTKVTADTILNLFNDVEKLSDASRRMMPSMKELNKNEETSKMEKQPLIKEPQRFIDTSKESHPKTWSAFHAYITNDLALKSHNQATKNASYVIRKNVFDLGDTMDYPKTLSRHVHFKEPSYNLLQPFSFGYQIDALLDNSQNSRHNKTKSSESLNVIKNASYTILTNSKQEGDLKKEKNYNTQQQLTTRMYRSSRLPVATKSYNVTTRPLNLKNNCNGIVNKNTTEKFTKKKKLLVVDFKDTKPSLLAKAKSSTINLKKQAMLADATTNNNKLSTYNKYIKNEQDKTKLKKKELEFQYM